jgi:UDP-2,3-diacylglucosamine pyrophosphatase LpxH
MLVLVSDLHITDETAALNVNPEAFELLGAEVVDSAARRMAREIHLVLLGDVLDLVRSDYWHRRAVPMELCPWGGTLDRRTGMNQDRGAAESQFRAVLHGVLASRTARALRAMLATLAAGPVPLRVTYVIGNHDRVMWNFPSLRAAVQGAWPEVTEFAAVVESPAYGVLARHGHEWDETAHGWRFRREVLAPGDDLDRFDPESYEVMAIGEAVTAELVSGLVFHAREAGAPESLIERLKDVNNVRPLLDVFGWLEWIGDTRERAHRDLLHAALRRALDGFLETTLAREWDRLKPDTLVSGDLVDRLEQARSFLLGPRLEAFQGRLAWFDRLLRLTSPLRGTEDALASGARSERVFQAEPSTAGIERVIYGHTHRARHDFFSVSRDGATRMYVNTGTFLPLIGRAGDEHSFASALQMTMVFVYRSDEDTQGKRPGTTSLDIWNGTRRKLYA